MIKAITWPVVALVGLIMAAIVVLSIMHVDAGIITNVLLLLGLGAVGGGVAGVHTLVNGNTTKQLAITSEANAQQLAIISDAVGKLAAAQPPSDPSSPGPDDTQVLTHV